MVQRFLRRPRANVTPSCKVIYANRGRLLPTIFPSPHRISRLSRPCSDGRSHLHRPNPPPRTSFPFDRVPFSSAQPGRAGTTWAHSKRFQTDTASSAGSSDRWSFPQASGSPKCRSYTSLSTSSHPAADVLAHDRSQGQQEARAKVATQLELRLRDRSA